MIRKVNHLLQYVIQLNVLVVCLSCFWISTNAQERIPVSLSNTQFNINVLDPSVSFEKSINDNQSFTAGVGITLLGDFEEDEGTLSVNPFIRGSYRNYYPRKRVKKELQPNSGNFIGILTGYNFNAIADNTENGTNNRLSNSYYLGPVWGIQRNYQSGIHLGLSIGGGFGVGSNSDIYFTGIGGVEFGFVIN